MVLFALMSSWCMRSASANKTGSGDSYLDNVAQACFIRSIAQDKFTAVGLELASLFSAGSTASCQFSPALNQASLAANTTA